MIVTPALDQQCDMACFIRRGRRPSEDDTSVKPSSLTNDAGLSKVCVLSLVWNQQDEDQPLCWQQHYL